MTLEQWDIDRANHLQEVEDGRAEDDFVIRGRLRRFAEKMLTRYYMWRIGRRFRSRK